MIFLTNIGFKKIKETLVRLLFFFIFLFTPTAFSQNCHSSFSPQKDKKIDSKVTSPTKISSKESFDTLILAKKTLIYKKGQFVVKANQAVGIKNGKITFVGNKSPDLKAKKIYRLDHHLLSPGLVNTHTHLPMSLFKGLVDNAPLKEWLENYIFPLEAHLVNEEFIRVGTSLASLELIQTGTTTFADMYFYNDIMAKVLDKSGLRGIIGVGIPTVGNDGRDWKQKVLRLKETYKDNDKIFFGLAPHSNYTVSPKDLKTIGEFSKKEGVRILIHVAETDWENQESLKKHGKTAVQHLDSLGVAGPLSLFVHAIHLNEKDIKILAKTKTAVAYNPESNMKVAAGINPLSDLLEAGIPVGLGTDGSGSNNNLNMIEEMDTGIKLQSISKGATRFQSMDMFKMATIEGAKALGLDEKIGTIEIGKWADIIAFDIDQTTFLPPYNLISHIVYSANGSEVDFMMVGGDVLMEEGEVKTLDKNKIHKESIKYGKKIEEFLKEFNANKK